MLYIERLDKMDEENDFKNSKQMQKFGIAKLSVLKLIFQVISNLIFVLDEMEE